MSESIYLLCHESPTATTSYIQSEYGFSTREEAEAHWAEELAVEWGPFILEVPVKTEAKESITLWVVRTDGFGGGRIYSTDLTVQHVVMQLNYPHETNADITYFTEEEYAHAHLADYIANHPANQPIKEASE